MAAKIAITEHSDSDGSVNRLVELRRSEKLNCLSLAMLEQLATALDFSSAGRLVLTGAGRGFCSGLDLTEVAGPAGGRPQLHKLVAVYRRLLLAKGRTTVLARGVAIGGGAGLVAGASRAMVTDDFRFRLPGGRLARLAAVVVPLCHLRSGGQLPATGAWLGCDLSATEALELGLVDRIVTPAELDQMLARFRNGQTLESPPVPAAARDEVAVGRVLADWEIFLREFQPVDGQGV